jgi:hypothetical protein
MTWEMPKRKPITEERLAEAILAEAMESVSVYQGEDGYWYALVDNTIVDGRFECEEEAQEMGLTSAMAYDEPEQAKSASEPPGDPYAGLGEYAARIQSLYARANAGDFDIRSLPKDLTRDEKNAFLAEQRENFRASLGELFGPKNPDRREGCWMTAQRYASQHWIAPRINNADFTDTVAQSPAVNIICWYREVSALMRD